MRNLEEILIKRKKGEWKLSVVLRLNLINMLK
jgi:hypothetical protein